MEAVGSELGEAIPLFLRPLIPGANPVVSGTINTLGFYYYYHPREAHHRCSPGLTLKFPSPRLEEGEKEEEHKKEEEEEEKKKKHTFLNLSSQDGRSLVGLSYPDLSAFSTGP